MLLHIKYSLYGFQLYGHIYACTYVRNRKGENAINYEKTKLYYNL